MKVKLIFDNFVEMKFFRVKIISLLFLLFIIVCFCLILVFGEKEKLDSVVSLQLGSFEEEYIYWGKKIDQFGPDSAYADFKETYSLESDDKQHTLAHIFGQLLYEKLGIKGLGVCDSDFGFGCYHSFFSYALSEYGLGVIKDLDKVCIDKWDEKGLGCTHGIGHGIIYYLGDDKLNEALVSCAKLTWKEPLLGCSDGVFMEYNFKTMQSPNASTLRGVDPQNPFSTCAEIMVDYMPACYFAQARLLLSVYPGEYYRVGELCGGVDDQENRESCFLGMGDTVGEISQYNIDDSKEACTEIASNEGILLCHAGVAWSFYKNPDHRKNYRLICAEPFLNEKICLEKADLALLGL